MPNITITISIPEGSKVVVESKTTEKAPAGPNDNAVADFYKYYLSDNGRAIFNAAAELETTRGIGYSFHDMAAKAGLTYDTVKSFHRNSGRSAKRWREDHGDEAPIRLVPMDYAWDDEHEGMRAIYRLPPGAAEKILVL